MLSQGKTLGGHKIIAGHLWNPTVVEELVRNEQAYKFLKNVRGSSAYWQDQLYDVLAVLQTLGISTWFLTLSAADLHWPEMIQAVAVQFGRKLSQNCIKNEYCRQKQIHMPKSHNWCMNVSTQNWGILLWIPSQWCKPTRPYNRSCDKNQIPDERMTSCPLLAVVKDAPKIDKDPDDVVCAFIDKYITAVMPPIAPEKWKSYQTDGKPTKTYTFWLLS